MKNSYREIFKGTSIIGGSSFLKLLISMVQTKFIAVFLGTFGVGLAHSYSNLSGMVSSFCGLGINNSAIRYISEETGENGDPKKAEAITAVTFFLVCCISLVTLVVFAVLAYPLAILTFRDVAYFPAILFLGVIAAMTSFVGGFCIFLQSYRKLAAIAVSSIISSILCSISSILVYYYLRVQGILIAMLLTAVIGGVVGRYYVKKSNIAVRMATKAEIRQYSGAIIKLGIAFFLQNLCGPVFNYINNLILLAYLGVEYTGLYYCAMNLSGALATFILNAMATDYYPRLVQSVHDPQKLQSMVDEQLDIGVHLAIPGLIFMVVSAPLVIYLFYTAAFTPAILALQILTVGVLGRVISWPLGYVLIAKADTKDFVLLEFLSTALLTTLLFVGTKFAGLNGAAAAFGAGYLLYIFVVAWCVFKKHHIGFGKYNMGLTILWNAVLIATVCGLNSLRNPVLRWSTGSVVLIAVGVYCLLHLMKKMNLSFTDCIGFIIRRKRKC